MEIVWVFLPFVAVVVALVALQPGKSPGRPEQRRLAAIERKLDLVMDHLGIVEPEPDLPDVVRALDEGKRIAAVKAYRRATGADLVEARHAVDAMAQRRGR